MIAFDDLENYTGLTLSYDGQISSFEMNDGLAVWYPQGQVNLSEPQESIVVSVIHDESEVNVSFGDEQITFSIF